MSAERMVAAGGAAAPITAANDFTREKQTEVPGAAMRSFFYRVPEGLTALRIDLDASKRAVGLAVIGPDTRAAPGTRNLPQKVTYVVTDPMPGMWEVRLSDIADTRTFDWEQAKKAEPVPATAATLTVPALATAATVAGTGGATDDLSMPNLWPAHPRSGAGAPVRSGPSRMNRGRHSRARS